MLPDLVPVIVSIATWLTPMPQHAEGLLVRYGPQYVVEANADFRGYDLAPYRDRCGLAVMSPGDLGRTVWVRTGDEWYGPCLAVDVSQRAHFYTYVYQYREVAEVSNRVARILGFEHGAPGETWVGACPPDLHSAPMPYAPPLTWDHPPRDPQPIFWPYPQQELPEPCARPLKTAK